METGGEAALLPDSKFSKWDVRKRNTFPISHIDYPALKILATCPTNASRHVNDDNRDSAMKWWVFYAMYASLHSAIAGKHSP